MGRNITAEKVSRNALAFSAAMNQMHAHLFHFVEEKSTETMVSG